MNEERQLIRTSTVGAVYKVTFEDDALAIRAAALESSALIAKVKDAKTQEAAVEAQGKLLAVIREIEKARQRVKKEFLDRGRLVDQAAKDFVKELDEEGNRVTALIQEFQEKERARVAAETQLQNQALSRLEREKAEKIACVDTIEEQDSINEEYSRKAELTATQVDPVPKARGQIAKPDWDVTVTDIHALYRANPNCVELKPRISEIKALLAFGVIPKGVIARQVVRSTVRNATTEKVIET